jgi:hypothetical protein
MSTEASNIEKQADKIFKKWNWISKNYGTTINDAYIN